MLKTAFNSFKTWAKILKQEDGVDYSAPGRDVIQLMANQYCLAKDTNDERNKNKYIAGLMLRFWYAINKLKERSPIQGLDYSDFMAWLYEAIEYACKYRAWQDPSKKTNAQQAINQCIETIRVQKYYDLNLQKNKANINTYSLETPLDDEGKTTLMDSLLDDEEVERTRQEEGTGVAYDLIQRCINSKKIVEAIILDTIAFNDVQKVTKTTIKGVDEEGNPYKQTRHTSEFWPFRCVQILSNLPEDYAEYFCSHYKIVEKELMAALDSIKRANNQKLYKYLDNTLSGARQMFSFN
jgi:hypothetical protein